MEKNNRDIKQGNKLIDEDELTIADIIRICKYYFKEIIGHWKFIFFLGFAFAIGFFIDAYRHPISYRASVTFSVNEDESQDVTGISGLLSAFSNRGGGERNLEKILQLFNSRRIILNALFQKGEIRGKSDYLANHIIREYGIARLIDPYESILPWKNNTPWIKHLNGFDSLFFSQKVIDSTSTIEEKVMLNLLYSKMAGNASLDIKPMIGSMVDEQSGIMRISINSISEDLTIQLVNVLYENLSTYYIDNTIEKQKRVYDIAKYKADSLRTELASADRQLAEFLDGNRKLVWVRGQLEQQKLKRKANILEIMYAEVIKQLELADFSLRRKTPYVSFIDLPTKPLTPIIKPKSIAVLFGLAIGFFIGTLFVISRKFIQDELKKATN